MTNWFETFCAVRIIIFMQFSTFVVGYLSENSTPNFRNDDDWSHCLHIASILRQQSIWVGFRDDNYFWLFGEVGKICFFMIDEEEKVYQRWLQNRFHCTIVYERPTDRKNHKFTLFSPFNFQLQFCSIEFVRHQSYRRCIYKNSNKY